MNIRPERRKLRISQSRPASLSDKFMRTLEIQIERWPVDRLIPSGVNPRTHSPQQVAQIAASIREFGFVNPILVGPDGGITAGEARLRAARTQGMREVPVIVLEHLSKVQRRALAIADNRLALNAGWDEEMFQLELTALREENFDVDLLGLDDEELARLLAAADAVEGLTDEELFRTLLRLRSRCRATAGCWAKTTSCW
jgi:ParB-like chromosome segregation protein Spo0J